MNNKGKLGLEMTNTGNCCTILTNKCHNFLINVNDKNETFLMVKPNEYNDLTITINDKVLYKTCEILNCRRLVKKYLSDVNVIKKDENTFKYVNNMKNEVIVHTGAAGKVSFEVEYINLKNLFNDIPTLDSFERKELIELDKEIKKIVEKNSYFFKEVRSFNKNGCASFNEIIIHNKIIFKPEVLNYLYLLISEILEKVDNIYNDYCFK